MKKQILAFILCFVSILAYSQPQGMSYQAIAYDPAGLLVASRPISLKFSILEGSSTGSVVYAETFKSPNNVTTNAQGVFSLNIGTGTAVSGEFPAINWGSGLKFLKVEMDASSGSGTTYTLVGTNQFMSVPYALYALNTNLPIKIFNTINDLRVSPDGSPNEVVYIKGHTTIGDGGQGHFIWRADLPHGNPGLADNDGTIIRKNGVGTADGAWIRLIQGKVNVKYFGVVSVEDENNFASVADQSAKINKAITFASAYAKNPKVLEGPDTFFRQYVTSGSSSLYFPAGTYKIREKIILKAGVSIEGEGSSNTIFKSGGAVSYPNSMIEIDYGQLIGINISNLGFDGGVDPTSGGFNPALPPESASDIQNCFYIKGHSNPNPPPGEEPYPGGLWMSSFKNIRIKNFNGSGIILQGSGLDGYDYLYPNQDLVFENVNIARQRDASQCLMISGMHGQLTFINCGFDGLQTSGNNASKLFNVVIEANAVSAAVIKFLTCTFQYSEYGAYTSCAESVTFDNCWFEALDVGVAAVKSKNPGFNSPSQCINVINSRFANAAGFGSLSIGNKNTTGGTCVAVEGRSNVNVQNNYVTVTNPNYINPNDYFIRNYAADSKINASNNSFQRPQFGKTLGIAGNTISIASNGLDTTGYRFVSVTCLPLTDTANNIKEIKSEVTAGETITIRAVGTGKITFDNSKNIILSKVAATSITLLPNETATFMKVDSPITVGATTYNEIYQLVAVSSQDDSNWNYISTFSNSTSSYDSNTTVRYRKKNGLVYLDGSIKGGTSQTNGTTYVLFTLPSEFRPSRRMSFPTTRANSAITNSTVGRIEIDTNGNVYGVNYSNLSNSLSNISFFID